MVLYPCGYPPNTAVILKTKISMEAVRDQELLSQEKKFSVTWTSRLVQLYDLITAVYAYWLSATSHAKAPGSLSVPSQVD